MLSKSVRRSVLPLALAMLCFVPLTSQAGTRLAKAQAARAAAVRHEGIVQAFWRGLAQMFEKNGASIDPSGQPGSGIGTNVPGTDDEGASIDPFGVPHG
jgi:hypothetical protein